MGKETKDSKKFEVIISRRRAKDFLNWECKRSIKAILTHLDNMEFNNSKQEVEKRKQLRSIILDNLNGLHKAWIAMSPVEWFDLTDEDEQSEYKRLKRELNRDVKNG